MWQLSKRFVIEQKKRFFILALILIFSFALFVAIIPLYDALIVTMNEKYIHIYGAQHAILYDTDETVIQKIREKEALVREGYLYNFGVWEGENGAAFTLGYMDEAVKEMGHLQLLEGRMPAQENEIILEQNVSYRFLEEIAPGSQIQLSQAGRMETFVVTGILKDYSVSWEAPVGLEKGKNDLPNLITAEGFHATNSDVVTSVSFVFMLGKGFVEEQIYDIPIRISEINIYNYCVNQQPYLANEYNNTMYLNRLKVIFGGIALLITAGMFFVAQFLFVRKHLGMYLSLYALGGEGEAVYAFYFWQNIILLLVSLPAGTLVGVLLSGLMCFVGNIMMPWVWSTFVFLLMAAFIVLFFLIIHILYWSIIGKKRGKSTSALKEQRTSKIKVRKNLSRALMRNGLRMNLKSVFMIVLMIGVLLSAVTFFQVHISMMIENNTVPLPDYTMNALTTQAWVDYDGFCMYETKDRHYDEAVFDELSEIEGISYIAPRLEVDGAVPFFEETTAHAGWKRYSHPMPYDGYFPWPEVLPKNISP
ncbi:MAG: ABC transporter permease [Christensenellaceae bacterium]|jgi:putative ABC transport system permease protein